jgi:hypothetical protein
MTTLMVWVLLYKPFQDDRPPHPLHAYATEKACQAALDDVVKVGFASAQEMGCARMKQPK